MLPRPLTNYGEVACFSNWSTKYQTRYGDYCTHIMVVLVKLSVPVDLYPKIWNIGWSQTRRNWGILSPFLFNFFINDLLADCIAMDLEASIKVINVSILAYCDDIILLSPLSSHLENFSINATNTPSVGEWSLIQKSLVCSALIQIDTKFTMADDVIPRVNNFIYLGLPIGDDKFIENFWYSRFRKVEKAFFALRFQSLRLVSIPNWLIHAVLDSSINNIVSRFSHTV